MIKLPKQIVLAILDAGTAREDTVVDNSRWSIQHRLIFDYEDQTLMCYYSVGATEQQDERPFEYDTEVECTPMKQVLALTWVPA